MSGSLHILRAIAGLPLGTIFVVDRRLRLGRAPDSDVQLMDPGVSRHHARVEVDDAGVVMLVDHSSRAGTSVDGVVVERVRLAQGSVITIGPFSLRYEVAPEDSPRHRPPPRRAGLEALRITAEHGPPRRRTTGVPIARAAEPTPEKPTAETPVAFDPPPVLAAVGALVRAIHELRVAGINPSDEIATRLLETEREPGRRRHRRFACALQAWLARPDGTRVATSPVDVLDLSAGGAQVSWRGDALPIDGPQWLVVDLEHDDDDAPIVVFSARVAWSRPDHRSAGLEFVGAPRRGIDAHELVRADLHRA